MSEEKKAICRICLEEDSSPVRVCKCVDKVHLGCLNTWRHTRARQSYALPFANNFVGVERCEVCLKEYKIPQNLSYGRNDRNNQNIRIKYFFRMFFDTCLVLSVLLGSYVLCGWYFPAIWRPENVTDGVKIANGAIWTHAMITVIVGVSLIVRSSSGGGCYFCYLPGGGSCDGEGEVCLIICLVLAFLGVILSFLFILTEIFHKRIMQMEAETYFAVQNDSVRVDPPYLEISVN